MCKRRIDLLTRPLPLHKNLHIENMKNNPFLLVSVFLFLLFCSDLFC